MIFRLKDKWVVLLWNTGKLAIHVEFTPSRCAKCRSGGIVIQHSHIREVIISTGYDCVDKGWPDLLLTRVVPGSNLRCSSETP